MFVVLLTGHFVWPSVFGRQARPFAKVVRWTAVMPLCLDLDLGRLDGLFSLHESPGMGLDNQIRIYQLVLRPFLRLSKGRLDALAAGVPSSPSPNRIRQISSLSILDRYKRSGPFGSVAPKSCSQRSTVVVFRRCSYHRGDIAHACPYSECRAHHRRKIVVGRSHIQDDP